MSKTFRLSELPPGKGARVTALENEGAVRRRLFDMGLVPGTRLRCVGTAPAGDPRAYRVRGTVLALRVCDSACITVEGESEPQRDRCVALAGNPNVGKSTLFNRLTGQRQHTGNWPGKTVALAEGRCRGEKDLRLVDLPGTYSLLARSPEEKIARDFLREGKAEAVVVVCDACSLVRSLPLALQVMELSERVLLCVNLLDEAARRGITLKLGLLEERLGVPVLGLCAHERSSARKLRAAVEALLDAPVRERKSPVRYPTGAAQRWRAEDEGCALGEELCAEALFDAAEELCAGVVQPAEADDSHDRRLDRLLTGKFFAWPLTLTLLALIFWLTIVGANAPSQALASLFHALEERLDAGLLAIGAPEALRGLLCEGIWRVCAWVVAVMLPPMAIFFPLFTLLEEAGFLPRFAYNLDRPFQTCRACGKQSLCMMMGLGCNAVGVTGCRIIDMERERLLAVLTNSLVPCNGRFPLLITLSSLFWIRASGAGGSLLTALVLAGLLSLSVGATFLLTWLLSKTLLRGKNSAFVMELPPYRRVRVGRLLLRSLRERTLFVLGRAAAVAAPAGALLWLLAQNGLLGRIAAALDPLALPLELDGAILLGFLLGLPANEIVLPIILMIYTAATSLGVSAEGAALGAILASQGWTGWTAGAVMLFSLFHWPCSTTLLTIRRETGRWRWAFLAALLPTLLGLCCCLLWHALHLVVG